MKKLTLDKGEAEIISTSCVNSKYKARFLADENDDYCQCGFGECKVRVAISYNGHSPYTYTLTEKEIKSLPIVGDKTDQYKCQSYVEGSKVIDCTCGKCF
jgi:hypothetical protein